MTFPFRRPLAPFAVTTVGRLRLCGLAGVAASEEHAIAKIASAGGNFLSTKPHYRTGRPKGVPGSPLSGRLAHYQVSQSVCGARTPACRVHFSERSWPPMDHVVTGPPVINSWDHRSSFDRPYHRRYCLKDATRYQALTLTTWQAHHQPYSNFRTRHLCTGLALNSSSVTSPSHVMPPRLTLNCVPPSLGDAPCQCTTPGGQ